ncbi:hypothetical protein KY346_04700 [Candidatus Woesearchaeota archaeon]|nr:hypothetical protein [Candidatus Woesearchaeota archaeon]
MTNAVKEKPTIEEILGDVDSDMEAKAIAQTTVSIFGDIYAPEKPLKVRELVSTTMRIIRGLQRKGYNMKPYCDRIVYIALQAQKNYSGENVDAVDQSTRLVVIDGAIYKSGTRYLKKKEN